MGKSRKMFVKIKGKDYELPISARIPDFFIRAPVVGVSESPAKKDEVLVWRANQRRTRLEIYPARLEDGRIIERRGGSDTSFASRDRGGFWHPMVAEGYEGKRIGTAMKRMLTTFEKEKGKEKLILPGHGLWQNIENPVKDSFMKRGIFEQKDAKIKNRVHKSWHAEGGIQKLMREPLKGIPKFYWLGDSGKVRRTRRGRR